MESYSGAVILSMEVQAGVSGHYMHCKTHMTWTLGKFCSCVPVRVGRHSTLDTGRQVRPRILVGHSCTDKVESEQYPQFCGQQASAVRAVCSAHCFARNGCRIRTRYREGHILPRRYVHTLTTPKLSVSRLARWGSSVKGSSIVLLSGVVSEYRLHVILKPLTTRTSVKR